MSEITIDKVSECLKKYEEIKIVPAECDEIMLFPSGIEQMRKLINVTKQDDDNARTQIHTLKAWIAEKNAQIKSLDDKIFSEEKALSTLNKDGLAPPDVSGHHIKEYKKNCLWRVSPENNIITEKKCEDLRKNLEKNIQDMSQTLKDYHGQITTDEHLLQDYLLVLQQYENQAPFRSMLEVVNSITVGITEEKKAQETTITFQIEESVELAGNAEEDLNKYFEFG